MVRTATVLVWIGLSVLLGATDGRAEGALVSREYVFKPGVELTIDVDGQAGEAAFRLRTVEFVYPNEDRLVRFSDAVRAEVSVSNLGETPLKVGVAIALFADDGSLVGVASGGSKWLPIKPQRRSYYTLKFTDVDTRIRDATRFRITVESR